MPAPRPHFLRRPASAPYFHPLFLIFQTPLPSGGGNQNLLPPAFKKAWWGPNYDVAPYPAQKMKFSIKDFFSKCEQIRRKLHFSPVLGFYMRNIKLYHVLLNNIASFDFILCFMILWFLYCVLLRNIILCCAS